MRGIRENALALMRSAAAHKIPATCPLDQSRRSKCRRYAKVFTESPAHIPAGLIFL